MTTMREEMVVLSLSVVVGERRQQVPQVRPSP
jgi:hypothetical protein